MARGLAIETSGRIGSVAVVDDGGVVGEDTFEHGLRHAAEMVPRIDLLVRAQGWTPADLREIYVSVGPGSFTGLRIGITFAKTLAFATGAAIVAVPSVEVLVRNAPAEARDVIIVLDAKREQIFTARLRRGETQDDWHVQEPAHVDSLSAMLSRAPRPVHLLGEGIPFHEKFLPPGDSSIIVTAPDTWRARAAAVAGIGRRLAGAGQGIEAQCLIPLYIRKPEAEERSEMADQARMAAK